MQTQGTVITKFALGTEPLEMVFDIYNDDFILQEGAKAGMLPESIEKEINLGKLQRENFRRALLGGARMAFGTDAGVYPHGDNAKQFAIMTEYGVKPLDAIRAATVNAAEILGRSNVARIAGSWLRTLTPTLSPSKAIGVTCHSPISTSRRRWPAMKPFYARKSSATENRDKRPGTGACDSVNLSHK